MNINVYKEQVAKVARKLYERQMVSTNEGNVSALADGRVYITPSQVCKGDLTPDMITVTDLDGNRLEGNREASSEIFMHLYIYKARPDVKGIVHNHSPFATAFAIARRPICSKGYTELIYFHDKIPVADYGAPGTPAITQGLGIYLEQTDIMLLSNHGLVAVATDVYSAYLKAEAAEALAKTLAITQLIGGEFALSHPDLDDLYKMRRNNLGKGPIIP